jgi:hypothetical protein
MSVSESVLKVGGSFQLVRHWIQENPMSAECIGNGKFAL